MSMDDVRKNLGGALSIFAKVLSEVPSIKTTEEGNDYPPIFDELLSFFPVDKVDWGSGIGDQYLSDLYKTVIDNYESGNYQVSYFYAHLIFMSYVYYCVEKAYRINPDRMKDIYYPINSYHGRDDKPDIERYSNVYEFSKIPEKDIFKVFHILGMDDPTIKAFSKYISSRDDFAHATGKGNISEDELISNIKTIIGNMTTLHKTFEKHLEQMYEDYILEHLDSDYETVNDSNNYFVLDNGLSLMDLKYLSCLGVGRLQKSNKTLKTNYQATRNIHCAFIEYCIENNDISAPTGYASLRNKAYLNYKYQDKARDYVEEELGISSYFCGKDGEEFPVYECPECEEEQLVYDADANKYHCFHCSTDFDGADLTRCEDCGVHMHANEIPLCENCLQRKMEED